MRPVYLDHHATTPVDPRVFEAMRPYFTEVFGNPSSLSHPYGWEAQEAVQVARTQVATLVGAQPAEIVFTSGATESNNLVLRGLLAPPRSPAAGVVSVVTEHRSVLDPLSTLAAAGVPVTLLPVDAGGRVDPDAFDAACTDGTRLASVLAANNEVGVLQAIDSLGRRARSRGVLFHTDYSQAAAWLPIDLRQAPVDLLTLSGHKMYGPKGVGALYVRSESVRDRLQAQMEGGGQERGRRAGTLNVPGIVGLGAACALVRAERDADVARVTRLRDRLQSSLLAEFPDLRVNGSLEHRLPNNLSLSILGADGERLLAGMKDIAVSDGSACNSAARHPSHVLTALGVEPALARATLRFGLGRATTDDGIDRAIAQVRQVVRRLRA